MGNMKVVFAILVLSLVANSQAVWGDKFPFCLGWPHVTVSLESYQSPVEISKYLGTWFEQARLPQQFQKGLCSKAVYTATEGKAEVITVNNGGDDPAYPDEKISGTATLTHHDALTSKFDLKFNFFAQGQYWILDLDADYKYALVGGPCRDNLYVLSRERHAPMATVQAMIQKAVTVHGYTNTDKMVYPTTERKRIRIIDNVETGCLQLRGFSFFSRYKASRATPDTLTTLNRTPGMPM